MHLVAIYINRHVFRLDFVTISSEAMKYLCTYMVYN